MKTLISLFFVILFSLFFNKVYAINIYTIEDLDSIRNDLTGDHVLMNDLDFNSCDSYSNCANMATYTTGEGWDPIGGVYDSGSEFSGTFNGNGFEISNLFINNTTSEYSGLFGVTYNSVISEIGVINATVTATSTVGVLIGYNNEGIVEYSYTAGQVSGNSEIGGLIGENYGTLDNSYSEATVVGQQYVGGLAGSNYDTISNSYTSSIVSGSNSTGGLVGYNNGTIDNSYSSSTTNGENNTGGLMGHNYGTVDSSYSTGNTTGALWVGGLVGQNNGTVSNSYSSSDVDGSDDTGGLVGYNKADVLNSYSTGNVTGAGDTGGLVGFNDYVDIDTYGLIHNTYSTGLVTSSGSNAGGLVGVCNVGAPVENSFWDTQTSGVAVSDGGTGKTTAEMTTIPTFNNTITDGLDTPWDIIEMDSFDSDNPTIWYIDEGTDYPRLSWENDWPTSPDDPEDLPTPSYITFHADTRCHWKKPGSPTWIRLEPMEKDGVSGMYLTWTQYDADKINIKIDNGTGTYPWKVEKTLNDGHEFLPNVGSWQNIMIKPINHCKEGDYSLPVSHITYPYGWYGQGSALASSNTTSTLGYSTSNVLAATSTTEESSSSSPMVPDTGSNDILVIVVASLIVSFAVYYTTSGKSRNLAIRDFENKMTKGL